MGWAEDRQDNENDDDDDEMHDDHTVPPTRQFSRPADCLSDSLAMVLATNVDILCNHFIRDITSFIECFIASKSKKSPNKKNVRNYEDSQCRRSDSRMLYISQKNNNE